MPHNNFHSISFLNSKKICLVNGDYISSTYLAWMRAEQDRVCFADDTDCWGHYKCRLYNSRISDSSFWIFRHNKNIFRMDPVLSIFLWDVGNDFEERKVKQLREVSTISNGRLRSWTYSKLYRLWKPVQTNQIWILQTNINWNNLEPIEWRIFMDSLKFEFFNWNENISLWQIIKKYF